MAGQFVFPEQHTWLREITGLNSLHDPVTFWAMEAADGSESTVSHDVTNAIEQ